MVRDVIRGRLAQKARPCPRLINAKPFGVSKAPSMESNQTSRGIAFDATLLIKPPALRGYLTSPLSPPACRPTSHFPSHSRLYVQTASMQPRRTAPENSLTPLALGQSSHPTPTISLPERSLYHDSNKTASVRNES